MASRHRGADALARSMASAGVRYIFTLSGNHIMPIFDAALDAGITLIHTRHEAAAVHMADAWARLNGEPGIALVTGGPGHANAVGALCSLYASSATMRAGMPNIRSSCANTAVIGSPAANCCRRAMTRSRPPSAVMGNWSQRRRRSRPRRSAP